MLDRPLLLARRYALDLAILGIAVGAIGEFAAARGGDGGHGAMTASPAIAVPAILAMTLPLLARRRFPFGAPAIAISSAAAFSFLDQHVITSLFFTYAAALLIVFLFAYGNDVRRGVAGLFLAFGMATLTGQNDDANPAVEDFVFLFVSLGLAWSAGLALNRRVEEARLAGERAERLEREREERALAAVTAERARIARELHDVVGHHLSVMTVQAAAARRLLGREQEREREALEVVERTGREALAEMRRMVGVLRRTADDGPSLAPQPGLDQLDKLVHHAREAGLLVELVVEGEELALPAGVDLTAYRIIQEGLTNVLKHAQADSARVVVRYGGEGLELVVEDDGLGSGGADGERGHGLLGMRERVAMYGGDLEARQRTEGGFRLRARLPLVPR